MSDPELATFSFGRRILYLRKPMAPFAESIAGALDALAAAPSGGEGNRRSAFRIAPPGAPEMIARASRRGGLMRWLSADVYLGRHPRPLVELNATIEARRRGIPVADPVGAMVRWTGPIAYRGFFLTRALSGVTLWEMIRAETDAGARLRILEAAHAAIASMHERGLFHADLNLHNLFVTEDDGRLEVIILDLDKARLYDTPVRPELRRANTQRLIRSARKLDPAGSYFDARAIASLISA